MVNSESNVEEIIIQSEEENEELLIFEEASSEVFDYKSSINKPKINDIELIDNKTSKDLGLQDEMYEISNIEIEELLKGMEW